MMKKLLKNKSIQAFSLLGMFLMLMSFNGRDESVFQESWTLFYDQNGIKLSYDVGDCGGISMVLIKVENTTVEP